MHLFASCCSLFVDAFAQKWVEKIQQQMIIANSALTYVFVRLALLAFAFEFVPLFLFFSGYCY